MSNGYPKYSKSAQSGELGVNIVNEVVTENLGWVFKRNHQESDFGIDGYIEVVSEDGYVTGKMFAVQIKCGSSFFSEENRWGYVYRGENKHFNYLSNCPVPVLILLCDPTERKVYCECFDPLKTEKTKSAWKMNISKQLLSDSKNDIVKLLPDEIDYMSELEVFWGVNKIINEYTDVSHIPIPKEEVENFNFDDLISFFKRLKVTKEIAYAQKGRVEISFWGYESDPRELLEIPEVIKYAKEIGRLIPDLFFFCDIRSPMGGFPILGWSHGNPEVFGGITKQVKIDFSKMEDFILYQIDGLRETTNWLNMTEDEYQSILESCLEVLGYELVDRNITIQSSRPPSAAAD
jgi:hypothetical protein